MKFEPTLNVTEDDFPEDGVSLTGDKRTEARLCAVQVLYQVIFLGTDITMAADSFRLHEIPLRKADKKIFNGIIDTAKDGVPRYLEMIDAHLNDEWSLERVDPVAKAILVAATAELDGFPSTSEKIILNEYINISKGFFAEKEVGFINGLLDTLSAKIR
jgi:N utilization substance protein B